VSGDAQNSASGTRNPQDNPVLKTRPQDQDKDSAPPAGQPQPESRPAPADQPEYQPVASAPPVAPNALPEGKRFIIKLKDTLDTRNLEEGQHFKAELREDLVTSGGLTIPRGQAVKGHVATFEHGYTGARMMLAMDEIETPNGWVPLVATVMGVPGDSSIKSTGEEGEFTRKGPDKKRVVTNAAIGAGVGAAAGAAAGGGKGAAIGAAAGAGLGSGSSFIFKGADLKLEKGTHLELRLDRDLVVPAR
jgi:hypothetical protein